MWNFPITNHRLHLATVTYRTNPNGKQNKDAQEIHWYEAYNVHDHSSLFSSRNPYDGMALQYMITTVSMKMLTWKYGDQCTTWFLGLILNHPEREFISQVQLYVFFFLSLKCFPLVLCVLFLVDFLVFLSPFSFLNTFFCFHPNAVQASRL